MSDLENLSPRELRENLTSQSALVRTLQQKIVNQRTQLKALQKAYDEQVQRGLTLADWIDRATKAESAVSEFVRTHCGLCQSKLEPCDCDEALKGEVPERYHVDGKPCSGPPMSYSYAITDSTRRMARGENQVWCLQCEIWVWPEHIAEGHETRPKKRIEERKK